MIKVMLVDDEQLLREGVRLVLRHADDIKVTAEAGNGAEAVRLACEQPIDVALVDIRMPGTDGLAAAEQIASLAPGVKVVMLMTLGEP
jgi:YesN/AraC family two-component response regulator